MKFIILMIPYCMKKYIIILLIIIIKDKKILSYDVGEKCLLKNYALKTNKKINNIILLEKNKVKKNKSFFKICVLIEKK